jgi:hypothetical protein
VEKNAIIEKKGPFSEEREDKIQYCLKISSHQDQTMTLKSYVAQIAFKKKIKLLS